MKVINRREQTVIVENLIVARSFFRRLKGLLGTACLLQGAGLLIQPCNSVHTFLMRYSIDVVFLDSTATVVKIAKNVAPGRIVVAGGSATVLEIPAGTVATTGMVLGDQLAIVDEN